jgi:hypothetical protein
LQWTGPPTSVLDRPRCGHLNPHQNSGLSSAASEQRPQNQASASQVGRRCKPDLVPECRGVRSRGSWSVVPVESRVSLGSGRGRCAAVEFVQSRRLKSDAPRDAHAGVVWGLGADADAGRDSWTTQKPATTLAPDPEKPRPVRGCQSNAGWAVRCCLVGGDASRDRNRDWPRLGLVRRDPRGGRVPREPRQCLSKGQSSPLPVGDHVVVCPTLSSGLMYVQGLDVPQELRSTVE